MEYPLMEPNFKVKDFDEMTKKEANKHFEWFKSQIPIRISLLKKAYGLDNNSDELDFSRESLKKLWSWYLDNVIIEDKSEEELKKERENANELTVHSIREQKISLGWLSIALDIGIYFSETMLRNHSELYWGVVYKPKSLISVNKPVLLGFDYGMSMESANLLFVQTAKILKGTSKAESLLKLYDNWVAHI